MIGPFHTRAGIAVLLCASFHWHSTLYLIPMMGIPGAYAGNKNFFVSKTFVDVPSVNVLWFKF